MINSGLAVSVDNGTTWYNLTDDNRQPIKITFEVIEKTNRMADGQLRRYVIARKHKLSTSWQMVASKTALTSDLGKAGAWMQSFYEANVFTPVLVKLTSSQINPVTELVAGQVPDEDTYYKSAKEVVADRYTTYITNFDYEVVKRNREYDLVNINIEFTEV
jgi:hypothetical protein